MPADLKEINDKIKREVNAKAAETQMQDEL